MKKISKETAKKLKLSVIILLIAVLIIIVAFYIGNREFRTFFDRYILRKEIVEDNITKIDISTLDNPKIYAYDKYITVLNKNVLNIYSESGKKESENEVLISDALYASNNRFLVIAQKNGQNIYLISDQSIVWHTEVEGEILRVNVNKNGYVSVIISGSSYKTIVQTFSPAGKELFKTYLSSTVAIDTSISNDNKYLSIAEINTSGTLIQSNIKVISVEKAQNDPTNSVVNTYTSETNKLITNIKYQDKNKLVIAYDDTIKILDGENESESVSFADTKTSFASIDLSNYLLYTIEKSTNLFKTNTQVILKNISTNKENLYTAEGVIKGINTKSDNIAINLGSQVDFINTNGWLVKRYISEKEIKDIVLAESIAGIVYKDKIEIVNI